MACPPGSNQVASCRPGADCFTSSFCGQPIYCESQTSQCDAYPTCDPGHIQVGSPSQCFQDDAVCYPRSICGTTIWCTGPSNDAGIDAGFTDASR